MNIDDITNISLGIILGDLDIFDLQKKYEDQFNVIKYIKTYGIGCKSSAILTNFTLPSLSELLSKFNDKKYKLTNKKYVHFGRSKVLKNDVILFGALTIPFENGENEFRFPYYSGDDSSITLLDEDGLILKGLTLNE